jgi:hypothetical protein
MRCQRQGRQEAVRQSMRHQGELRFEEVGRDLQVIPRQAQMLGASDADHILAAAELADWLELQPFVGCKKAEQVTGADWYDKVAGRTGIICFEDYYTPSGGSGGDHIDLWSGSKMTATAQDFVHALASSSRSVSGLTCERRGRFGSSPSTDEANSLHCSWHPGRIRAGVGLLAVLGCIEP